jgi:hypothetical protein
MNRRQFAFSVLAGVAAAGAGEARAQGGGDAVAFVSDFYTREIARHNAKEKTSEAEILSAFTPAAQKIWVAARDNKEPPPAALGNVIHVFLGPGALPGREVKLVKVGVAGGGQRLLVIAVDVTIDGNPRKLHAYVVRDGNTWRFDDIDYGQRQSFMSYYRYRAGL